MKKSFRFLSLLAIVGLVLFSSLLGYLPAQAATMSVISVDMNDGSGNNVSAPSTPTPVAVANTVVVFDPATAVNSLDGIKITFASDFDVDAVVNADVTVTQAGGNPVKGTAAYSAPDSILIPITTEGTVPGNAITVTIANSHIFTPTTTGTKTITITTWDLGTSGAFGGVDGEADTQEDTGSVGVLIGTNNVLISGVVEPTLTLALSSTTCALGTLLTSTINTCNYTTTVSTNGTGGYTSYIRAGSGLISGANEINALSGDGTIAEGTEGYGVATNGTNNVGIQEGVTCPASGGTTDVTATGLTTADQSLASKATPANAEVTTVCHAAAISGVTQAGSYTQTVTITVVGNF